MTRSGVNNQQRKTALKMFESVAKTIPPLKAVIEQVDEDGFYLDWDLLLKYDNRLMLFLLNLSGQIDKLTKEVFESD